MTEQDREALDRQVREWRREVARLQDLISIASSDDQGAERQAFENWARRQEKLSLQKGRTGGYLYADTARAWDA